MVKKISIKTNCGSFVCRVTSSDSESGYTVTVPTLKGVVTEGRTLAEAKKMAKDAIELHCEGLLASGLARVVPLKSHRV